MDSSTIFNISIYEILFLKIPVESILGNTNLNCFIKISSQSVDTFMATAVNIL